MGESRDVNGGGSPPWGSERRGDALIVYERMGRESGQLHSNNS